MKLSFNHFAEQTYRLYQSFTDLSHLHITYIQHIESFISTALQYYKEREWKENKNWGSYRNSFRRIETTQA